MHHRHGQCEHLLLTAGQFTRRCAEPLMEYGKQLERLRDPPLLFGASIDVRSHLEVLVDCQWWEGRAAADELHDADPHAQLRIGIRDRAPTEAHDTRATQRRGR